MSYFYIVATPIGNLQDITLRALETLRQVDFILSEDTRVTKKLLDHFQIATPLISYHEHSDEKKIAGIIDLLEKGKNLALVSDAGTPGISDPGGKLIAEVIKSGVEAKIEPIPGVSALATVLSISGIPNDRFLFLGFLPHKKGRQTLLKEISSLKYPVVVYESKHRILKLLKELSGTKKQLIIGRELTKMHETVYRGAPEDILNKLTANVAEQKGEFVVIIY
jgi:16S rRNA (cytidine1402-2'-O)-methyltransferase